MMDEEKLRHESSMNTWWPRLKDLPIPVPKTKIVDCEEIKIPLGELQNGEMDYIKIHYPSDIDDVKNAIKSVGGPPAFLRTDQASNKHDMGDASKIDFISDIERNIQNVIDYNMIVGLTGLPYDTLYVREWVDFQHTFKAFNQTPINAEMRAFILDGEYFDSGFYWPKDAIKNPTVNNWEGELEQIKNNSLNRQNEIIELANIVAREFNKKYWSVDFALGEDDNWYCIDMARGEVSWHPDSCEKPI